MKRALIVLLLLLAGCAPSPEMYSGSTTSVSENITVLSIPGPFYRITDLDNKVVCWGSSQVLVCKTFAEMGK